jgi:DUF1365 family protein
VNAALYESVVRHQRLKPSRYALRHRTFYWLADIDDLPKLPWWARPLATFPNDIRARLGLSGKRIYMLTHAKVFGYAFNPLTVYWCFGDDGDVQTVVAEVHNTYGGSHCYFFTPGEGELGTPKEFYVSPFFEVAGDYAMRLPFPQEKLNLVISLLREDGRHFNATLTGNRKKASIGNLLKLSLRYPFSTFLVTVAIRFHGIRLYLRGLPVIPRTQKGTS